MSQTASNLSHETDISMRKYLNQTWLSVANFEDEKGGGWNIPLFEYTDVENRVKFIQLVWDLFITKYEESKIIKYLNRIIGDEDLVKSTLDSMSTKPADDLEQSMLKSMPKKEEEEEKEEETPFVKLFFQNFSPRMTALTLEVKKYEVGILQGCRYALSERRKFDFFVKYPAYMPRKAIVKLGKMGFTRFGKYGSKQDHKIVLQVMNSDKEVAKMLNALLKQMILALPNSEKASVKEIRRAIRVVVGTKKLPSEIFKLSQFERYVLRNIKWAALSEFTAEGKRKDREGTYTVIDPETGRQEEYSDYGGIRAPIGVTDREKLEMVDRMKRITGGVMLAVGDFSKEVADWWRNYAITGHLFGRKYVIGIKEKQNWLAFADILELYANLAKENISIVLRPENESAPNMNLRGKVVYRKIGRRKATYKPIKDENGDIIDYSPPKFLELVSNVDMQKQIKNLANEKRKILKEALKYSGKAINYRKVAHVRSCSVPMAKATIEQGEMGIETLLHVKKPREYFSYRFGVVLPGIWHIIQSNPDKYNSLVISAFFGMTGVFRGFEAPVLLDNGKLRWRNRKFMVRGISYVARNPDTGKIIQIPAISGAGSTLSPLPGPDGKKETLSQLYYRIRGWKFDPIYISALQEAGVLEGQSDKLTEPPSGCEREYKTGRQRKRKLLAEA